VVVVDTRAHRPFGYERPMLDLSDERWASMRAGYRVPVDVRPLIERLETGADTAVWAEIWQELYHQGDVGEASYAAIPHLARIYRASGVLDWNTFAIAATIDLARDSPTNPSVPDWLREGYERALDDLARLAIVQLADLSGDPNLTRSALSLVALRHGARTHARLLVEFSDDEVRELLDESGEL
jgi:hypothetical protein